MADAIDAGVERLKSARDNGAVLKLELIKARGRCPSLPIFVVEGVDDKSAYAQWVRRIRGDLRHEYFVCSGKRQVLTLRDLATRDKAGLAEKVFFFIDRDFDDYAGHSQGDDLFMTEAYSIENYLVDGDVVEDILNIELHCNCHPDLRGRIRGLFNNVYLQFLRVTEEMNFRMYVSKRVSIPRTGGFPERINQIAVVTLDKVEDQVRPPEEVIALGREPTPEEAALARADFKRLDPPRRYRGKFALLFFHRWLDLLADDYASKNTEWFGEIEEKARARRNEIVLASLASRSPIPAGLPEFLGRV